MREQREGIILLLQGDTTLTTMLPPQPNWAKGGNPQRKWSIMPLDGLTTETSKNRLKPLITVQMGNEIRTGYNLLEDFVFIRCYNANDKAYITIDDVLSRVKVLLHRHRFNFAGSTSIETLYESTSPEFTDEAFGLKFRESQYRLLRI